ncbi:MAG: isopentenyl-diphosphate Delta-isomerase [Alphaproteobacteria bacterium]|nr:isopentenyl-diphosphate Delta-isomerase [Alphaproteobacteria bacterium]
MDARAAAARETYIPAIAADGSLYRMEKMAAHRAGARHLAISVFVMDGDALLLQRRAASKYHCGGLWANTCCSHPDWGESVQAGARRRLREEMGLDLPLTPCGVIDYRADVTDGLVECERVHVFRADARASALRVAPDPHEVSETRWAAIEDVRRDARAHPLAYAPWFRIYLDRWEELGL